MSKWRMSGGVSDISDEGENHLQDHSTPSVDYDVHGCQELLEGETTSLNQ